MIKILIVMFSLVSIIYANIAFIPAFNGKAEITRDGKIIDVVVGIKIKTHDSIKTYDKTKLQLMFKDKTRITIGKNSQFSVEDYLFDEEKPNKVKATFRFSKGLFRTISGKIGKLNKNKFKIKVKSATIGIRGTEFVVLVTKSNTKISVSHGAIYFTKNNIVTDVKQDQYFVHNAQTDKREVRQGSFSESKEFDLKNEKIKKEASQVKITNKEEKPEISVENNVEIIEEYNKISIPEIYNTLEDKVSKEDITTLEKIIHLEDDKIFTNPVQEINSNYKVESMINSPLSYLDYGYWNNADNDRVDTYITGTLTPEAVIQNNMQQNNKASYSGGIASIITNNDGTKYSSAGMINLNINFGSQKLDGVIDIDKGVWKANIAGNINSTSFSSSSISGTNVSRVKGITGDLKGKFYGTNADAIGGNFNLQSKNNGKVSGTFIGAKQ
jgi:hypothetical protein